MMRHIATRCDVIWLAVFACLIGLGGCRSAPPAGRLDFYHVAGYMDRLQRSRLPADIALRQKIADGPTALVSESAAARREGIPLTLSDLRLPPITESESAADDYSKAAALESAVGHALDTKVDKRADQHAEFLVELMFTRRSLAPRDIRVAARYLSRSKAEQDAISRATAKSRLWSVDTPLRTDKHRHSFRLREGQPPAEEFASLRYLMRLLRNQSCLRAVEGRYLESTHCDSQIFRMAGHCWQLTSGTGYVVGNLLDAVGVADLRNELWMAGNSPAVINAVQRSIAAAPEQPRLSRVLKGDVLDSDDPALDKFLRSAGPAELNNEFEGEGYQMGQSTRSSLTSPERRFVDNLLDAARADYLHDMRRLISVADRPMAVRGSVMAELIGKSALLQDPVSLLRRNIYRIYPYVADRWALEKANRNVLIAGAAVLAYHARHGFYPQQLGDALNAPKDPFGDGSLRYRREHAGFVVYSVGSAGQFDGGKPGDTEKGLDAFFRYPGPPVPTVSEFTSRWKRELQQ